MAASFGSGALTLDGLDYSVCIGTVCIALIERDAWFLGVVGLLASVWLARTYIAVFWEEVLDWLGLLGAEERHQSALADNILASLRRHPEQWAGNLFWVRHIESGLSLRMLEGAAGCYASKDETFPLGPKARWIYRAALPLYRASVREERLRKLASQKANDAEKWARIRGALSNLGDPS